MSEQQSDLVSQSAAPAAGGRRRAVVIGGIAAVVLTLGGGAYVLFGAADDAATTAGGPPVLPSRTAVVSPSANSLPSPIAPGPATEPNRHDPFKPLYSPKPIPPTASPTPAAPVPSALPSGNPLPTTPGGVVGPGTPGTPGATQNVVKLLSISGAGKTPMITVSVDGVPSTGKAGEVLASILQIVSIRPDDGAATFQLGDATFDLHIGQSYTN